jgi:hypothetical protein
MSSRKMTTEMTRSIRAAIAQHEAAVAFEATRWGAESAANMSARGICFNRFDIEATAKTMQALLNCGAIAVYTSREVSYETTPNWGRGRRSHVCMDVTYIVTEAGLAAA